MKRLFVFHKHLRTVLHPFALSSHGYLYLIHSSDFFPLQQQFLILSTYNFGIQKTNLCFCIHSSSNVSIYSAITRSLPRRKKSSIPSSSTAGGSLVYATGNLFISIQSQITSSLIPYLNAAFFYANPFRHNALF